jgi:hypothetical protein
MRFRVPVLSFLLIVAIGACGKRDPVAKDVKPVNVPLPANVASPDPHGAPPENKTEPAADVSTTPAAAAIPEPLRGRWGLTPADCTSPAAKAKGLLIVTGSELRFYESRAVPSTDAQTAGTSMNGHFQFTGEGQAWDKFEALQRSGDKLTRTETNPAASYTYAKC